jgi:hypothetical protein
MLTVRTVVECAFERMLKEEVVAYFKLLSRNFLAGTFRKL